MLTGSADITLNTLKMILADIELIGGKGTGNKIMACIKNTMSDRHIVERSLTACWKITDLRFCHQLYQIEIHSLLMSSQICHL